MQSEQSFVIAVALMAICLMFCLWVIHQQMKANQIQMTEMRQNLNSLANLAAAKDISAYAGLEAISSPTYHADAAPLALDDESTARRMQNDYEELGLDPRFAVNTGDDPLADFGGTHSLI